MMIICDNCDQWYDVKCVEVEVEDIDEYYCPDCSRLVTTYKNIVKDAGKAKAKAKTTGKSKCEDCGLKGKSYGLPAEGKKRWCAGCAKAHVGAVDADSKMCEGCGLKRPSFGLPAEGKKRWCAGCAKAHVGAVDVGNNMCEGCGLKRPSIGLAAEGKKRWCGGCAKAHVGALYVGSKMCEGCGLTPPYFGLPAEGKKRWCAGCAKAHAGAVDVGNKMCEGCGLTQPYFGLPVEGKKRWCAGCAKAHVGAVDAGNKMCDDCTHWRASFGLAAEVDMRWCVSCARAYEGAVSIATGNAPTNSARAHALKIPRFELPAQARSKLEDIQKGMLELQKSEKALQGSQKLSAKDIRKAKNAWKSHLLKEEDASCQIMCSLLSDREEIRLVTEVESLGRCLLILLSPHARHNATPKQLGAPPHWTRPH
jgi:hypothetical protein